MILEQQQRFALIRHLLQKAGAIPNVVVNASLVVGQQLWGKI